MSVSLNRATIPWIANNKIPDCSRIVGFKRGHAFQNKEFCYEKVSTGGYSITIHPPLCPCSTTIEQNIFHNPTRLYHSCRIVILWHKGLLLPRPPLCAKFVPRISLHIWIKGGLEPTFCPHMIDL